MSWTAEMSFPVVPGFLSRFAATLQHPYWLLSHLCYTAASIQADVSFERLVPVLSRLFVLCRYVYLIRKSYLIDGYFSSLTQPIVPELSTTLTLPLKCFFDP